MMFMMFVKKKSQKRIINTKVRVFTTDIQYKLSKSKSYVRMPSRDQERGATVNEHV